MLWGRSVSFDQLMWYFSRLWWTLLYFACLHHADSSLRKRETRDTETERVCVLTNCFLLLLNSSEDSSPSLLLPCTDVTLCDRTVCACNWNESWQIDENIDRVRKKCAILFYFIFFNSQQSSIYATFALFSAHLPFVRNSHCCWKTYKQTPTASPTFSHIPTCVLILLCIFHTVRVNS